MTATPQPPAAAMASPLDAIRSDGLVPLVSSDDPAALSDIAEHVAAVGLTTLEVTLRVPGAVDALSTLTSAVSGAGLPLHIGAGTVLDGETTSAAIKAGARFVVSPTLVAEAVDICRVAEIPYIPGCATPSEIHAATRLGCEIVKLFPADAIGGPAFLRAVRSVFPGLEAIPTGGIVPQADALQPWFEAGAVAVGVGSHLFPSGVVTPALRDRLVSAVGAVAAARAHGS